MYAYVSLPYSTCQPSQIRENTDLPVWGTEAQRSSGHQRHESARCLVGLLLLTGAERREWMGMGLSLIYNYYGSFPHSLPSTGNSAGHRTWTKRRRRLGPAPFTDFYRWWTRHIDSVWLTSQSTPLLPVWDSRGFPWGLNLSAGGYGSKLWIPKRVV